MKFCVPSLLLCLLAPPSVDRRGLSGESVSLASISPLPLPAAEAAEAGESLPRTGFAPSAPRAPCDCEEDECGSEDSSAGERDKPAMRCDDCAMAKIRS